MVYHPEFVSVTEFVKTLKLHTFDVWTLTLHNFDILESSPSNVTGPAKIDHVSANYTELYFR